MATKREAMLAGVAAKLAHMIASDAPATYTPAGTDVNGATLLETNWVILQGVTYEGAGVRLRPATGQYLHVVRNPEAFGVYVYPAPSEQMNLRGVGGSWYIAARTTGFFLPSQKQWLCGSMLNDTTTTLAGPISLGTPAPADAAANSLFVNYLNVPWSVGVGGASAGRINFNCYFDTTTALRYIAPGPAYRIVFPGVAPAGMHVRSAPVGAPDALLPALTEMFAALDPAATATGQTNIFLVTNEAGVLTYQQVLVGPAGSGPGGSGRALYVAT
jgi:hypothetical protein